jgi:flavin-dependent dehydrogenase
MPRDKLCGEFIAPECSSTLKRLGVLDRVIAAGSQKITSLRLTASNGRQIGATIGSVSNQSEFAISLSRSRFDQILFERAREVGAQCLEGQRVSRAIFNSGRPCGVEATSLPNGRTQNFESSIIIDASGRNSRLTIGREERIGGRRGSRLYGFKAHLRGVEAIQEQVELYFFDHGYGGLSRIEDELVNLCFIASERTVREAGKDLTRVLKRTVMLNPVARERLAFAELVGKWHSSGPLRFGRRLLSRDGLIAVGDASGMIDPFTGTGIQIALRTGEMAAASVVAALGGMMPDRSGSGGDHSWPEAAADRVRIVESALSLYQRQYDAEFGRRLASSRLLRRVALSPSVANGLAAMLSHTPWLAQQMVRATRSGSQAGG